MDIKKENLVSSMKNYAKAKAELKKIELNMEEMLIKAREKYQEKLKKWLQVQAVASEKLQASSYYHYDELFATEKSIDLEYGVIGFKKGDDHVVKNPKHSWEEICDTCQNVLPEFVQSKKTLAQDKILAAKDTAITEKLEKIGLSIVQDEYFFIHTYEESPRL